MSALLDQAVPVLSARPLMPTERRVLLALARGETHWSIGAREGLSRSGMWPCIHRIHTALGASSSAHAVGLAHRFGLLPRDRFATPVLTPEELVLLGWIADGVRNAPIAERLGLKLGTAADASRKLYRRLGARNRPNAVHVGYCTGLLGGDVDG